MNTARAKLPHPVDINVGKRLRHRRWNVGMTQQQLGENVGIQFQQIQKYETGANRISASRLWMISKALDVEISFFFEGLSDDGDKAKEPAIPEEILSDKEALQLLRSYYFIPKEPRRKLLGFMKSLAKQNGKKAGEVAPKNT